MRQDLSETITVPEGVEIQRAEGLVTVKGPQGEVTKKMNHPRVDITIGRGQVKIESPRASRREKTQVFTYKAHIKNMVQGVQEPYTYKVKVCSGHFPMNVSQQGNEVIVKNFLGEKVPRILRIREGADINIEGEYVTITSCNKEVAGQVAAELEQLTRITNRDRRIFQDGLFIVEKAGVPIV